MLTIIEKRQAVRDSLTAILQQTIPDAELVIGQWADRATWTARSATATVEALTAARQTIDAFDISDAAQAARATAANRAAAEALLDDRSPMLRVILAKAIVDYQNIPALRNAFATLAGYLAAIKATSKSAALD